MKNISYKIFIQKRGFVFTTDMFVWSGILGSLIFSLIVDRYFHDFYISNNVHKLMTPIVTGFLVLWILMYFISFTRTRKLRGHFEGNLELKKDDITINDKKYSLTDIKSIEFYANDFRGRFETSTKSTNPRCSQGIDNQCKIVMNTGEKIVAKFLIEFENQLKESEDVIMHYFKEGKIQPQNVMQILGINSYSDMQAFKQKHNH